MFSYFLHRLFIALIATAALFASPGLHASTEQLDVKAERKSQLDNKTVALRYELIRKALVASGMKFTLSHCELPPGQVSDMRYTMLVKENKGCNIASTSAGSSTTDGLLLVPIPMYLGAGGYRVLFINKASRAKVESVRNLEDLKSISIGSGTSWVDTNIMRAANLQVETSDYENLFRMLDKGRFDAFSRSILEVFNEKAMTEGKDNIIVDDHLLIYFPNDLFFYVSPKEPEIQKALTKGLERLYASGEMMQILRRVIGSPAEMKTLKLHDRVRIDLPNPFLKAEEASVLKKYASDWIK